MPRLTDGILQMIGDIEWFRGVKDVENDRSCMIDGDPRKRLSWESVSYFHRKLADGV